MPFDLAQGGELVEPFDICDLLFENTPGGLKVLPSFCVVPAMRAFPHLGDKLEWSLMLHGEQVIRLSQPLSPEGKIIRINQCQGGH